MNLTEQFPIDRFTSKSDAILKSLPASLMENIENLMIEKNYRKGQNIFLEGSYPAGVFYIKEGMIKKYKTDNHGKEQILYLCSNGELLGYSALLCSETYPDSASAIEPSKIGFIPRDAFLKVLSQSNELMLGILSCLSHEFGVLVNSVSVFARMSVRERSALILLVVSEKYRKTSTAEPIEIRLFREDLANMVGTAVETLVRILQEFKQEGIISINGRTIRILDPKQLIQISRYY